jgi:hypothetical protein
MEGIGPQSFGTYFEVSGYDANNHLLPLTVGHYAGTEDLRSWGHCFDLCRSLRYYDIPRRVCIADMEKSIDTSFKQKMTHAKPFCDERHVKKNMAPKISGNKEKGLKLYASALRAPSKARVDAIVESYDDSQKLYLLKYPLTQLYKAYAELEDLVLTSQGAESTMSAALRNKIRAMEPQDMLQAIVTKQHEKFYKQKSEAEACSHWVPPRVERHVAGLIGKAAAFSSVRWVEGPVTSIAYVACTSDPTKNFAVTFTHSDVQTPPECCAYSKDFSGFPCYHGVAAIIDRHGAANVCKYVAERHTTRAWKRLYRDLEYNLPVQSDVDDAIVAAKRLVLNGHNLHIPKALAPPRGRPSKDSGKRKGSWFEQGPSGKKNRPYCCSLCHSASHLKKDCPRRQADCP